MPPKRATEETRIRKAVFVLPFPPTPDNAGYHLEVLPLSQHLTALGTNVVLLNETATGSLRIESTTDSLPRTKTAFGGLGIPSNLHEAASRILYETVGVFVPPFFGIKDIKAALAYPPRLRSLQTDGVVVFKPWLRTVVPGLRIARAGGSRAILWIDDLDVSPNGIFMSEFDAICVNSRYLASVYRKFSPVYIPHVVESDLIRSDLLDRGERNVCDQVAILFPGTGFPTDSALGILKETRSVSTSLIINVVCPTPRLYQALSRYVDADHSRVRVLPRVPRAELITLLDRQALCIVPQPESPYGKAKASGRLLECIARGVPAIVPQGGESEKIVREGDCGLVYDAKSQNALATQVARILASSMQQRNMSVKAVRYSLKRGSWDTAAISLSKLLLTSDKVG